MRRRFILISALLLIGVFAGLGLSHLISNTTNFNVTVADSDVLQVTTLSKPNTPLYKEVWYNDTTIIKVHNKDTIQGYQFLFYMRVNTTASLQASDMTVVMRKSTDGINFGGKATISLSQFNGGTYWWLEGNYNNGGYTNIGAKNSGNEDVWFEVNFRFNAGSPSTTDWTFHFFAWGDNLP